MVPRYEVQIRTSYLVIPLTLILFNTRVEGIRYELRLFQSRSSLPCRTVVKESQGRQNRVVESTKGRLPLERNQHNITSRGLAKVDIYNTSRPFIRQDPAQWHRQVSIAYLV